jgi:hypothetical protein
LPPPLGQLTNRNVLSNNNTPTSTPTLLESRRKLFMSEKEKKEEQILKQRAELALKKGTAELDPRLEKEIEQEVLATLEAELTKLLQEDSDDNNLYLHSPMVRKVGNNNVVNNNNITNSGSKNTSNTGSNNKTPDRNNTNSSTGMNSDGSNNNTTTAGNSYPVVDIDDLFDINNLAISTDFEGFGGDTANSTSTKTNEDEEKRGNEFAAELLYIMKTSMQFS